MKMKQDLEKAITDTKHKFKNITFGNDFRICEACLNRFQEQENIDKCRCQEEL